MTTPDVDLIIRYEQGEASAAEILGLFAGLIKSGMAWHLQGSYGRAAASMIEAGLITTEGEITDYGRDAVEEKS